jgi:hypothetical protein
MKKKLLILFLIKLSTCLNIIAQNITLPPSGENQKSTVIQWIGPVSVSITYSSPNVTDPAGKDRRGQIWGELVPYGFVKDPAGLPGTNIEPMPWRTGANGNTTITFSHEVLIEGKPIKAGTYGLFLTPEKDKPWTWIFSTNSSSWGSYYYQQKEDVLRVSVQPLDASFTEWLMFGFDDRLYSSTTAYLQWENKRAGFKIEVPNINELYLTSVRNELRFNPNRNAPNYIGAANFCLSKKVNLEEGLNWANLAIGYQESFNTLRLKSRILTELGRTTEADEAIQKALNHSTTTASTMVTYGRGLLREKQNEKAMQVFKLAAKRFPQDKFVPNLGLAHGYTALGDKKNAIKSWEIVIKNVPEDQRKNLESFQKALDGLKK